MDVLESLVEEGLAERLARARRLAGGEERREAVFGEGDLPRVTMGVVRRDGVQAMSLQSSHLKSSQYRVNSVHRQSTYLPDRVKGGDEAVDDGEAATGEYG